MGVRYYFSRLKKKKKVLFQLRPAFLKEKNGVST